MNVQSLLMQLADNSPTRCHLLRQRRVPWSTLEGILLGLYSHRTFLLLQVGISQAIEHHAGNDRKLYTQCWGRWVVCDRVSFVDVCLTMRMKRKMTMTMDRLVPVWGYEVVG